MNISGLLATQRTQRRSLLVCLVTGAILVYFWSVFVFYPITQGYGPTNWLHAVATGLIFIMTYLIQKLTCKNDKTIRTSTRVFAAFLIVLTLASVSLMVIPYVASHSVTNFFDQNAYNDPVGYWPYLPGEFGNALQSSAIFAFAPWTYHLVVACLVVLAFNLVANKSNFRSVERKIHWGIIIFCGLFFLLWLVPWPWITYWVMD